MTLTAWLALVIFGPLVVMGLLLWRTVSIEAHDPLTARDDEIRAVMAERDKR